MNKIILASILALFLIVGIGCVAAADSNLNNANGNNPNSAHIGHNFDGDIHVYTIFIKERPSQTSHPTIEETMEPKIPHHPGVSLYGDTPRNNNRAIMN